MTLPNFIVIGAAKAGTSSLFAYMRDHPEIYLVPRKETKFFQFDGETRTFCGPLDQRVYDEAVKSIGEYEALFDDVRAEKAIGEITPSYMYTDEVPHRIHRRLPEARLVAVLRHPAERAFSQFLHMRRMEAEPERDFARTLELEDERIARGWGPSSQYRTNGLYHRRLAPYFELFGREQVRAYLYEDFASDTERVLAEIYRFLGVDPGYRADVSTRHNEGALPRSELLHALIDRPNPLKSAARALFPADMRRRLRDRLRAANRFRPRLDPAVRRSLVEFYREDLLALEDLIARDLSAWRDPARGA